jgi:adhesin transport system outer membrane protein
MRPRLDFRAGLNLEHDIDGTAGRRDKSFVELILRYNLYNGGIDQANIGKAMEGWKQAGSLVNKVKRDVTQSVLVSYNDIQSIQKQLNDLRLHRNSADTMRNAYLQQFEAGRRSLLDLLDVENEYFQANIAYANALFDLKIAKASYLATTGKLLARYGIFRKDVPEPAEVGIDVNAIADQIAAGAKKK